MVDTYASSYSSIAMMGKSGGANLTAIYAGLDPRIRMSFPLCGTAPSYLKRKYPGVAGNPSLNYAGYDSVTKTHDDEQVNGGLRALVSWMDLYAMNAPPPTAHQ